MTASASQLTAAYPKMGSALAAEIVAVARRVGVPPEDLAALINFESAGTFASDVKNPMSGATGLIQFMPSTAKRMGTTTDALAQLTPVQQMTWVEKYLSSYAGRMDDIAGLAMAVFYPAYVGRSLDTEFSAKVQRYNPGISTVGDYVALMTKRAKYPTSLGASASRGSVQPSVADIKAGAVQALTVGYHHRWWFLGGAIVFGLIAVVALVARLWTRP